ncbi:hypothetical protein GNI_062000 [Gregarina niphandrodes]|uniref:Uncharacterized protein n=1 Tax=Gregarina niphandrodes TaxID=110365 RepID=A0A023B8D3_GRENI|nr:hypothetical protein GNI_062000 [Gregarina niphandrodes]EZG68556.1 hypothetical protein GNI_062000 [Gregarina niphandrodes]|eukprot:XP_011134563.1 hypothetical protein GNI_062000 [Gregarina niphandrodes]
MTFGVDDKWVDLVDAFGSFELSTGDTEISDDFEISNDLERLLVDGCEILADMPNMVVGLENARHEKLSNEELQELHGEFRAKKELCCHVLRALHYCLSTFAGAWEDGRAQSDLRARLLGWLDSFNWHLIKESYLHSKAMDPTDLSEKDRANYLLEIREERTKYLLALHDGPYWRAIRAEGLKFNLHKLVRCNIKKTRHIKTCDIPFYQPCHPQHVTWSRAVGALNRLGAEAPAVAVAVGEQWTEQEHGVGEVVLTYPAGLHRL